MVPSWGLCLGKNLRNTVWSGFEDSQVSQENWSGYAITRLHAQQHSSSAQDYKFVLYGLQ
jgi:hypothetical protein